MPPFPSLGSWWTAHLHLPGYDSIATAGPCHFDFRAAEQALVVCTQTLPHPLSPWEEAIVLNLWGWRQADGRRRYATVYAEPSWQFDRQRSGHGRISSGHARAWLHGRTDLRARAALRGRQK